MVFCLLLSNVQLARRAADPRFIPTDADLLRLSWLTVGHSVVRINSPHPPSPAASAPPPSANGRDTKKKDKHKQKEQQQQEQNQTSKMLRFDISSGAAISTKGEEQIELKTVAAVAANGSSSLGAPLPEIMYAKGMLCS